jgi:hypothetical protein
MKQQSLWKTELSSTETCSHGSTEDPQVRSIIDAYNRLEATVTVSHHLNRVSYDAPVNFNEASSAPRHRWFPYKEGYSPSFVRDFLALLGSRPNVLDPFLGVGTTLLEAGLQGGSGTGVEISPLAAFISRVKTQNYSKKDQASLRKSVKEFENASLRKQALPPENETVVSYYEPAYLDALLAVKCFYRSISNKKTHDLFKLAFLSAVEFFSTHRKAGNGLKKRTKLLYNDRPGTPREQVRDWVLTSLDQFAHDLEAYPKCGQATVIEDSSLNLDKYVSGSAFDGMLTSPPYANCFDYSKIYMCELWLGDFFLSRADQQCFREHSIRSHVHARWAERHEDCGSSILEERVYPFLQGQDLWSKHIPDMLRGYFRDLGKTLSFLRSALKPGALAGIVVSNSVYGGVPVATDLLIAEIGQKFGFKVESLEVYRYMIPSSQQFVIADDRQFFRETMVLLRNDK